MPKLSVFDIVVLEKLCQALAEGMTGSQMTLLLARINAPDPWSFSACMAYILANKIINIKNSRK